jgi:glycosyltransferase involved in cell wall biosynthesis
MIRVSVVVPCHDCADSIGANVAAVLAGTYPPDEIVLVDDASRDGTLAALRELAARDARVRVVALPRNGGPARARNAGAAAATGEHLFFLDADTRILPDAIERYLGWVGKADAVVGMYDSEPLDPCPAARYKASLYAYLLGASGPVPYDQFSASCAGIRAAAFRGAGGYDESFPPGLDFENEEFGHRIAARYVMVLDPAIRARHRFGGWRKLTRTFFLRTALWTESFARRRRFNSVAGTARTGAATLALAAASGGLLAAPFWPWALWPALGFYALFLRGYGGFLLHAARARPQDALLVFALCHYYTNVIAAGALYGAIRVAVGRARLPARTASSEGAG